MASGIVANVPCISNPSSGTEGQIAVVLPLRDMVVFPDMIVTLFVGRAKSVRALEEVMRGGRKILLLTQKNPEEDDPSTDGLYSLGTFATVLQFLKLPDQTVRVLVEGKTRAHVKSFCAGTEFFQALIEPISEQAGVSQEIQVLMDSLKSNFESYAKFGRKVPSDILAWVARTDNPAKLTDTVASHLSMKIVERQKLLETVIVLERLERLLALVKDEIGLLQEEHKIRDRVRDQVDKAQREHHLNERLKAIAKELAEGEDGRDELAGLKERIRKTNLSKEAREKSIGELKKLHSMSPMSPETTVVRTYLDWMLALPWGKKSKIEKDIRHAETILNDDHYGLDKVKERILEYLAVQQRTDKMKGPILCLVGPPGVGKTSLGKSIARATGRKFVRMSLGGVRDEAEIRGHRRTYIGSMPGKIIQSMKKAKTANPLFLLDEVDKLGADWHGDPSAALLEVLDPEQNHAFNDHYLDVDFDLSDVMFVTTANTLHMPKPLMDRMEIIRIPGYTEDEKVNIAKRHLLSKQIGAHGLKDGEFSINQDALLDVIRYYTHEAGVRNFERELANLARKAVKEIVSGKAQKIDITRENLAIYSGVRKFRYGEMEGEDQIGLVTGLAWTEMGGETLTIESVVLPGKGRIQATGLLGDVMKESIDAARSYVRSRALTLGIKPSLFDRKDIHVHVPEGATPKDGPSAGMAMAISIISALTIPVKRNVAMTGEITLRGRILPVGGLKEKLLAALRAGLNTVVIPSENERDLAEISDNVKSGLEIRPVSTMEEVLKIALARQPVPVAWEGPEEPPSAKIAENRKEPIVTH